MRTRASIAANLASWGHALTWDAVPDAARAAVRRAIADTLAVAIAGMDEPVSMAARNLAMPDGVSRAGLVSPASTSTAKAAFANAVAAHALDYDDTCFSGLVHGSAVIVPAGLAVALAGNVSGKALMRAVLAGSEICYALGEALGSALYETGWYPTGVLGGIGAAAAAGLLLELDEEELAAAISIASVQAFGQRVVAGTAAKPYLAGRAAEMGVEAALAARAGVPAPSVAIEGRNGLFDRFGDPTSLRPELADTPGHPWRTVEPGLVIKSYPLCSCAQSGVDAMRHLLSDLAAADDDIDFIRCRVTPLIADTLRYDDPQNLSEAMFSLTFALAVTARYGSVRPDHLTGETLESPRLKALMKKVESQTDPNFVDQSAYPEATDVELILKDGRSARRLCRVAVGDPRDPLPADRFEDKLRDCFAPMLGRDGTASAIARLAKIDDMENLDTLWDVLTPNRPRLATENRHA